MNIEVIYQIILALAGVGTIMYGIKVMNGGVEGVLGLKFKKALAKNSSNYFKNYVLGTGLSFAVQTSTVTNIMTTGLINIGTINLSQGIAICLGAGFGSSLALVLLMFESVSLMKILSILIFVGAIVFVVSKSKKGELVSKVLLGLGLLCLGITILSSSMENLISNIDMTNFFKSITNPVLLILICAALTMIMQSGYPVIVILISLVSSSLLSFESACFSLLGINIGAALTISLIMSGFGEGFNGRRIVIFNFLCKFFFAIILALLMLIPNWIEFINVAICQNITSISLIVVNILFSFVPIVLLPFCPKLAELMKKIIKDKKVSSKDDYSSFEIDDKSLRNVVVAYSKLKLNTQRIFELLLAQNEENHKCLFEDEKFYSKKSKIKAIEKAIKLTNNNLISIGSKFIGQSEKKISTIINIVLNLQGLSKVNNNLDDICLQKEALKNRLEPKVFDFLSRLSLEVLDFGQRVFELFDENISKRQKSMKLKEIFKTNDIMISERNKSKKKLSNEQNFAKNNSVQYFNILYELENLQQEYFDIAIKLMILED